MRFLVIAGCIFTVLSAGAQNVTPASKKEQNELNNAFPANTNSPAPVMNSPLPVQNESQEKSAEPKTFQNDIDSETMSVKDSQSSKALQMNASFRTNQYNSTHQYSRRSATIQEQSAMDQSVKFFQAAAPESFEANYYHWLAGHYDVTREKSLEKALELQPANIEVLKQTAMLNVVKNETAELSTTLTRLDSAGYFTPGQLSYASAVISSCEPNSTLVLHGFDDFLAVSYVDNPNKVNLVSLDLMQSDAYRDLAAEKIAVPQSNNVDVAFFDQLCKANASEKLNLSMTIPSAYLAGMQDRLFVNGLTFIYSSEPVVLLGRNTSFWKETSARGLIGELAEDKYRMWLANYRAFLAALKEQSAGQQLSPSDQESIANDLIRIDSILRGKSKAQ